MRSVATHGEHNAYLEMLEAHNRQENDTTPIPRAGTAFLSYVPFDHNKTPLFQIVCAYQIFNAWLYGIYIGSIDTILTGFMIHAKAQFLILKNLLAHVVEKAEELYVRIHCYKMGVFKDICTFRWRKNQIRIQQLC